MTRHRVCANSSQWLVDKNITTEVRVQNNHNNHNNHNNLRGHFGSRLPQNSVSTIMAEQFILFSSESENEGRRGARRSGAPAVSITAPALVGEYIAPQTEVEEET